MANPQTSYLNTTLGESTFVGRRRLATFENTLLVQLNVLKETGRYDAFKLKWHPSYNDAPNVWPVPNHLFWDSDVAKWIEGACYLLQWRKNEEVDAAIKELVDMIRSAQQPDGYLNIHFTVVEPEKRFTNLRDLHELYNAGHLIEAALAHTQLYKNDLLLSPILKYVDLLHSTFGPSPSQTHGYPGHPEIELALLRLYKHTRDPAHLSLARFFLTERGNPTGEQGGHYYDVEASRRGDDPNARPVYYPSKTALWYYSAHAPIVEQRSVEGHAVRAMYLLTGLADLLTLAPDLNAADSPYRVALTRLWDNMVGRKMYLTGGIGAMHQYEGFGLDYFLPQSTDEGGCYAETCAGIGVMMLAERMLQLERKGEYADVAELAFYNAVMTGMSVDGRRFTYVNQLASSEGKGNESRREEWFTCACCPPNVMRLMGYFGGYLWSWREVGKGVEVDVHLYMSATLEAEVGGEKVMLRQSGNYPWEGEIDFELESKVETTVRLRIPGWAEEWKITPAPERNIKDGYLTLTSDWLANNPKFRLSLPLKPRPISPHPYTNQDVVALARGPIVYCVEQFDHPWVQDHFKSIVFDPKASISERYVEDEKTKEAYVALTAHNAATSLDVERLQARPGVPAYSGGSVVDMGKNLLDLHFVPYYFRANRGPSPQMRVGLRRWR